MSKELFVDGNYVIAVNEGVVTEYGKTSQFTERSGNFVTRSPLGGELTIAPANAALWDNAATLGVPYTAATMRTFLRANTGN